MHKPLLLISSLLALAVGLGFVSFGAQATTINVDLSGCGGSASCTSDGVTFQGWENDTNISSGWAPANLTYKSDPFGETGLGVACTSGDKCNQHEIDTTPKQYISAGLGFSFNNLSLSVGSVDSGGGGHPSVYETAYIYGSTCANFGDCLVADLLGSYTYSSSTNTHTFTFTAADLSGYTFLYVTPLGDGNAPDANILLSSLSYSVPEPAVLGMFGLGVLLIGLFAGLRRSRENV